MAQTTKTDRKMLARQRQARLAAELRSNLRKRKQQARARAQRADAGDAGSDEPAAPQGPAKRDGGAG